MKTAMRIMRNWRSAMLACAGTACAAAGIASPAQAQTAPVPDQPKPETTAPPPKDDKQAPVTPRDIVVYGNRALAASLKDFKPEQVYDEDRIAGYGANSVGELLDGISTENGDNDPLVLINGRPATSPSEIADLPVEAVARVEQMPRGSSSRVGAAPGQRTYNVVLKPSVNTMVAVSSYQLATEGGWDNTRSEATLTYIRDNDRINLTLRGAWSGELLESERPLIPLTQTVPYSPLGNLLPQSGTEIDPALSLAAGQTVSLAGVPVGLANPGLNDFAARAGLANPSQLGSFRSLRGRSRPYEASLTANKVLAPWLSASFNGRLSWSNDRRLSGLPSARFVLPLGHPNSPFSRNVVLAYSDPARPLTSTSRGENVNLQVSFTATFGDWRALLSARYDDRDRSYSYQLTGTIPGGTILLGPGTNPFATSPAGLIPVTANYSTNRTLTREVMIDAEGPVLTLPSGAVRVRLGAGGTWLALDGTSTTGLGERHFRRDEYEARGGITIPLIGGAQTGTKGLGPSEFSLDATVADLGSYGTIDSLAMALTWQAAPWLRLTARQKREEVALAPEMLASLSTTLPNVPYFDPVSGQTVEVTLITGGAGNLANEQRRVRQFSINASPWKAYNLQLGADFLFTDFENQAGPLPLPSPAIVTAFPDRFVRDGTGRLVLVDSRTVNFASQHSSEMRLSLGFSVPLGGAPQPAARPPASRTPRPKPGPRTVLQVNLAYSHVFTATSTIRESLGPVDLLAGGEVGLYGGRVRDAIDGNLGISNRGSGLRLGFAWRGPSFLASGTALAPDLLRFEPTTRFDLKVFADGAQMFGASPLTRGLRLSVSVDNLGNTRQAVRNQAGTTPLGYQPYYRDALGRTITFELRKSF